MRDLNRVLASQGNDYDGWINRNEIEKERERALSSAKCVVRDVTSSAAVYGQTGGSDGTRH